MLKSNLLKLKKDLEKKLKREVPWEEISEATGISTASLKKLASAMNPGVTNTAACRSPLPLLQVRDCRPPEILPGPWPEIRVATSTNSTRIVEIQAAMRSETPGGPAVST